MRKKFQLSIAALALLVMTASGSREESVSGLSEATATAATATPATQGTIVFTFTGNKVKFAVTAESIAVDWGDGQEEVLSSLDSTEVRHTYAGDVERTVRIQTEKLSSFSCRWQQLTALDVSNCPALTYLDCGQNPLSTLDVSGCTALTHLHCENNQLSALDISGCTALRYLYCDYNQLSADAFDRIFTDLPDRSGTEKGSIPFWGNPGTDTCDRSIAAKKNWRV
jgi:Leucine-rich repeat (LRR) protein